MLRKLRLAAERPRCRLETKADHRRYAGFQLLHWPLAGEAKRANGGSRGGQSIVEYDVLSRCFMDLDI